MTAPPEGQHFLPPLPLDFFAMSLPTHRNPVSFNSRRAFFFFQLRSERNGFRL